MAEAQQDIDIGGGEGAEEPPRIQREQEDSEDGHKVEEKLLVEAIPFDKEQTRFVERTFTFNCNNMSTSFHFRVTLTTRNGLSIITVLRRTDRLPEPVDVELSTTVGQFRPEVSARHIFNRVESGRRYADSSPNIITRADAEQKVGQEIPFEIKLSVQGCHEGLDLPAVAEGGVEAMDTSDSDDSSSRKRQETIDTSDPEDSSILKRRETMATSDAVEASPRKRPRQEFSASDSPNCS